MASTRERKKGPAADGGFESVAEAYLCLLKSRGVDWLFANAGTDFAPIIEALTRGNEGGRAMPEAVAITHENVAVGMAHGYYQITGRPQAVMFHVNVGTANALMGLINAARDNVPMLFTSGRTPITEGGAPARVTCRSIGGRRCSIRPACCARWSNGTTSFAMASKSKRWSIGRWRRR